ncbi:DUF5388 domain-containing protein [Latilactobacillus fragifolii]|uniref:DUF5388 domain-containing protein n=1 Tax=Latilactobacillus fragifolii TaxID=2814244 RepID=UPI001ABAE729|nr:DUF5388 domain-containing protein [Latilactobacillus fragifolii]
MGSLLNSNRTRQNSLDRGGRIEPAQPMSLSDLDKTNDKSSSKIESVTYYANVRINNHIKNKAEALSIIGIVKSQKEAIDRALDAFIDQLSEDEKRSYKNQVATLEEKDVKMKAKG